VGSQSTIPTLPPGAEEVGTRRNYSSSQIISVLEDPQFFRLQKKVQREVLLKIDPDYRALAPQEQWRVLGKLAERRQPEPEEEWTPRIDKGTIGPRAKPGFFKRIYKGATGAIPGLFESERTVYHPKFGQKQFLTPEDVLTPGEQEAHPITTGALEMLGEFTNPSSLALIAGSGGLGMLRGLAKKVGTRGLSGLFSFSMMKGAYDQYPELKEAMDRGDKSEALRFLTRLVISGAMGTMAGAHAFGRPLHLFPSWTGRGKTSRDKARAAELRESGDTSAPLRVLAQSASRSPGSKGYQLPSRYRSGDRPIPLVVPPRTASVRAQIDTLRALRELPKTPREPVELPRDTQWGTRQRETRGVETKLTEEMKTLGNDLTRRATTLLAQSESIKATGTFEKSARPARRKEAPVDPDLLLSERGIIDLNKQIVAAAEKVKSLRAEAEITSSPKANEALFSAQQSLELLAETYRPIPKAAGRMVKAFDRPVPKSAVVELEKVGLYLKEGSRPGMSDYLHEAWVNFLLSGPITHVRNITSNTLVRLSTPAEKGTAAGIDFLRAKVTGTPRERFFGEVAADFYGMTQGLSKGVRSAVKAWKTELPVEGIGKVEFRRAIPGRIGKATRAPGRALMFMDEFFKAVNKQAELHSLSYRKAAREGLTGTRRVDRINELLKNPPKEMLAKASKEMLYRVFQQEFGPAGQAIAKLRSVTKGVRYIIPFLRTPINIAKYGLERTPLNFLRIGSKQMKARTRLRGGELSDQLAKATMGSVISAGVVYLASQGYVTGGGPSSFDERRVLYETGWQPYSVKVGDSYYSYNSLEPVGALFGLAADFYENFEKRDELTRADFATRMAFSVSNNIISKTYMRGLSFAMDAISDPERYAEKFITRFASSLVPTVVAHTARMGDPYLRTPENVGEAIKARIPGLSEEVPLRRGVFGDPIRQVGGPVERMLSPARRSKIKEDGAIEKEMARLKMGVGLPSKKFKFEGETQEMTSDEYDRYQQIAGQEAREVIGETMKTLMYQGMEDGDRKEIIREIIRESREWARDEIISNR
jgi:hypothetical protein